MPQLTLEYTNNFAEKNDFSALFKKIHAFLTQHLPADLASCKSRVFELDNYYVGDGNPENAFVHVQLAFMQGRSPEKITEVGDEVLRLLKEHFSESLKRKNFQITLEVRELAKTYLKILT